MSSDLHEHITEIVLPILESLTGPIDREGSNNGQGRAIAAPYKTARRIADALIAELPEFDLPAVEPEDPWSGLRKSIELGAQYGGHIGLSASECQLILEHFSPSQEPVEEQGRKNFREVSEEYLKEREWREALAIRIGAIRKWVVDHFDFAPADDLLKFIDDESWKPAELPKEEPKPCDVCEDPEIDGLHTCLFNSANGQAVDAQPEKTLREKLLDLSTMCDTRKLDEEDADGALRILREHIGDRLLADNGGPLDYDENNEVMQLIFGGDQ